MEDILHFVVCIIAVIQSVLAIIMISCLIFRLKKANRVCVLVIGDIGRSPRMQNHALSLAKSGHTVDLVGLPGTYIAFRIFSLSCNEVVEMICLFISLKYIPTYFFSA